MCDKNIFYNPYLSLIYSYLNILEDIGDPVLGGALHGVEDLGLGPDCDLQHGGHEGCAGVYAGTREVWQQGAVAVVDGHVALLDPAQQKSCKRAISFNNHREGPH